MVFLCLLAVLFLVALAVSPFIGPSEINWRHVFDTSIAPGDNTDALIFFEMRLPRCILAMLAGGALAAAGVAFQALLRNPLATPYTLGVSGGGTFGAVLAILMGWNWRFLTIEMKSVMAFAGVLMVVGFIYLLSRRREYMSTTVMLLAGITLNFFFSGLILLTQYLADFKQIFMMIHWTMGDLDTDGWHETLQVLPFYLIALGVLFTQMRSLNLISVDSQTAASLGVNIARTRLIVFLAASILTGAVIAQSGPIAFVEADLQCW